MGTHAFADAHAIGAAMALDDAVAFALAGEVPAAV
jgi:hypothetical protein